MQCIHVLAPRLLILSIARYLWCLHTLAYLSLASWAFNVSSVDVVVVIVVFFFFSFVVFCSYLQPVGIYPKKYEWAGTPLHLQGIHSPNLGGDCSLMVKAATIDFDDGAWECQVTASDFTTQDALTSEPVQLVVRGELKWNTNHLSPSDGKLWS